MYGKRGRKTKNSARKSSKPQPHPRLDKHGGQSRTARRRGTKARKK